MNRYVTFIVLIISICTSSVCRGQTKSDTPIIELEAVYTALPWYNATGGIATGFVYMDNSDVTAKINFDKIFKFDDKLSLFIYGLGNNGQTASGLMGDFQIASNIESVKSWRIFEMWMQHNFINDRISLLVGLYDLNSEFDVLRPGTVFINSSFGIGAEYAQAGRNGPSIFPVTSLGVRVATFIGNRTRVRLAVLDAVPGNPQNLKSNKISLSKDEGALIAAEVSIYTGKAFIEKEGKIERPYSTRRRKVGREFNVYKNDKINFGTWYFTNQFQQINDSLTMGNGNFGVYLGMQKYFQLRGMNDFIALFGRFGLANSRYNRLGSAVSGGFIASNPITRVEDSFGLAFSSAINGHEFQQIQNGTLKTETALEFTYVLPLASWLLLQPDIQYIINPSTRIDLVNPFSYAMLVQITINNK